MKLLLHFVLIFTIAIAPLSASNINSNNTIFLTPSENSNCDATVPSNGIEGGRQCSANDNWSIATDIIVPADNDLTLTSYIPSIGMEGATTVTSVRVQIYNNGNDIPGELLSSQNITPTSQTPTGSGFGMNFSDIVLDLSPVTLQGSAGSEISYWIAIQVTTSNNTTAYIETATVGKIGVALAFSDGNGFIIPDANREGVYSLLAECTPMDGNNFPAPYCGPLVYSTVEPITLVEIGGIQNVSNAQIGGSPAHQDFTDLVGELDQGQTYEITLEGNTAGEYENYFVVFIDWNQNNSLDDEGEVYVLEETLINSTGRDGIKVVGQIAVPNDAILGNTRMRVKKMFGNAFDNPCTAGTSWGQVEDYTIHVNENLGVSQGAALAGFSYYPNPTMETLNIKADKNIESISIYNLLGQQVFTSKVGANSSDIDVSNLSIGTYVMKVSVDGQIGTYKLIKQ